MEKKTFSNKEISLKIVYWGAEDAGKMENVFKLSELFGNAGRLVNLLGDNSSTIYLELRKPLFKLKNNYEVRYLIYAAPEEDAFRKNLIFQGVDGIVFIIDSDRNRVENNRKSFLEII